MRRFFRVARADRRDVAVAFVVLFGVLVSHSMLETARDALFLASLPASRLPWVYLGIAAGTLIVVWLNDRALRRFEKRRLLQATMVLAAVVTAGFWLAADEAGVASLYGFYVWTGLVATVLVAQFWILLSDRFNVSSAKRAYAVIGAGGLVGATTGAAAAGGLLELMAPDGLLLVAPAVLLATAVVATFLSGQPPRERIRTRTQSEQAGMRGSLRELLEHPYLSRLLGLVLITAVTVTAVDLTFKTVVAREVAAEDLGSFFAAFYAALNGIALVVQLLLASRIIAVLGVNRTLLVLPLLLVVSALGFVLTAAALAVLLLKGFDGVLRHSLNRTGTEVLYVPVPSGLRARSKVFIDGVGARGGQALAALGVLGAVSAGASPLHLTIAVAVCAGLWLAVAAGLQHHYLELFRQQLRAGSIETRYEVPDLDLHSLETLLAALNSEDERMVINALELLEHSGRAPLIPALILYHPSPDVVHRALDIFVGAERTDFVPLARRLLSAVDPDMRAAALRAIFAVAPDEEVLREAAGDSSAEVRATAIVGLSVAGLCDRAEFEQTVREIAETGSPEMRLALARAIPGPDNPELRWALEQLAGAEDPELWSEIASTIAQRPHEEEMPVLLPMLASRVARPAARQAFVQLGSPAIQFLARALRAADTPERVRVHIPRTISRFATDEAADCLLRHLRAETDSRASYKSLRGLGRMVADDPELDLDRELVGEVAKVTVRRALTLLSWRLNVDRGGRTDPTRATPGAELLVELLAEKEQNQIERVFRLLGLLHPEEDFERIYAGLFGGDDRSRASSRELVEAVVEEPVRSAVLALSDNSTDSVRLLDANGFFQPMFYTYEEQLAVMLKDTSESVRLLAAHHVAELGLDELAADLAAMKPEAGMLEEVIHRALQTLGLVPPEPSHSAS